MTDTHPGTTATGITHGGCTCKCNAMAQPADSEPPPYDPKHVQTSILMGTTPHPADSEGSAEPTTAAGRRFLVESLRGDPSKWADTPSKLMDRITAIEAEARAASPVAESRLREALTNLIGMVEENGPDYANADAMQDARRALGIGIHEAVELGGLSQPCIHCEVPDAH